nr:hypothetical protein [Tanacetum cinerariifolium]
MQTTFEMEEPSHPEFDIGANDQPIVESSQHPEWFSQQKKPPTLDRDWNKTLSAAHRSIQPWISDLAKLSNSRSSFNELMDIPPGPTYKLMKGSCKSLMQLKFLLEEVYKAITDQLDWVNPEAYESDKIILDTYGDTVTLKRRRKDDADKDEEPSIGPDRGSKRRKKGKEPESASAPKEKATRSTTFEMEEPSHPEFDIGANDQPIVESSQHPEWFSQQKKPPTLDRDWNKTLSAAHRSIQPWISDLAKLSNSRSSFNELMDIPRWTSLIF